jgi:hypothetical protein
MLLLVTCFSFPRVSDLPRDFRPERPLTFLGAPASPAALLVVAERCKKMQFI